MESKPMPLLSPTPRSRSRRSRSGAQRTGKASSSSVPPALPCFSIGMVQGRRLRPFSLAAQRVHRYPPPFLPRGPWAFTLFPEPRAVQGMEEPGRVPGFQVKTSTYEDHQWHLGFKGAMPFEKGNNESVIETVKTNGNGSFPA